MRLSGLVGREASVRRKPLFYWLALIVVVGLAYFRWFKPGIITWGDWWYEHEEFLLDWWAPSLWSSHEQFGRSYLDFGAALWIPFYWVAAALEKFLSWDYGVSERLLWYGAFPVIGMFSISFFCRVVFPGKKLLGFTTAVFFLVNTYICLLASGGHISVVVAYSLMPLVLALYVRGAESGDDRVRVLAGLAFALQICYELRVAWLTIIVALLWTAFRWKTACWKSWLRTFVPLVAIPVLLNMWWILPFRAGSPALLPAGYTGVDGLRAASFSTFRHGLAMFHPQWHENVLGEVNPVPWRFFLVPLLAFGALALKPRDRVVRFFAGLALLSIFFVKGANPPLRAVNFWVFQHVPGFSMYRDPSKFFVTLAFSYAVLTGVFVQALWERYRERVRECLVAAGAAAVLVWLMSPLFTGEVGGTFELKRVPEEYMQLKDLLSSQEQFFRTLWVPVKQRFGYYSMMHPRIDAVRATQGELKPFAKGSSNPVRFLSHPLAPFLLDSAGVKYVVVPYDSEDDVYKDYKPKSYYLEALDRISWLRRVDPVGGIDLYETEHSRPHLYAVGSAVAVAGDADTAGKLVERGYLDDDAVFIFMDWLPLEQRRRLLRNPRHVDEMVFANTDWRDLAVDAARGRVLRAGRDRKKFDIQGEGEYAVFLRHGEDRQRAGPPRVVFDGRDIVREPGEGHSRAASRWQKIADIYLSEGSHVLELLDAKVVLVPEKDFQESRKTVQRFMNDSGVAAGYIFSDRAQDLKDEVFHVFGATDYEVTAKISAELVRGTISGLDLDLAPYQELAKWTFMPHSATCAYYVDQPGVLTVSSYFDGGPEEDEYVQMKRVWRSPVDLEQYPLVELHYRVDDPSVQTIEMVLGLDLDGDGGTDEYIRGIYPERPSKRFERFRYHVLKKAEALFPGRDSYKVTELEAYPHKLWGVDCRTLERRGEYLFHIKSIRFSTYSGEEFIRTRVAAVEDRLGREDDFARWKVESHAAKSTYEPHNENLIITAEFSGKAGEHVSLARPVDHVKLDEYPFIELDCRVDDQQKQIVELVLGLDLDGDGREDEDVSSFLSVDDDYKRFNFNLFEIANAAYPNEAVYELVRLEFRLRERRVDFEGSGSQDALSWYFKDVVVYQPALSLVPGFELDEPILEIDGKEYGVERTLAGREDANNVVLTERLHLSKGMHTLTNLVYGSFHLDWVVFRPLRGPLPAPEVEFEMLKPSLYRARLRSPRPCWLVFSDRFHPDWSAGAVPTPGLASGAAGRQEMMPHYMVNGFANGWYVGVGEEGPAGTPADGLEIVLEFTPRRRLPAGLLVSGLGLAGCAAVLVFRRGRKP